MQGIDTLAQEFFNNRNVCVEPKNLNVGDMCFIVDVQLIDPESDFYAIIPVRVVALTTGSIPGRVYYHLKAEGSKIDDQLNTQHEAVKGVGLTYYKILENTSPYIFLSNPATED